MRRFYIGAAVFAVLTAVLPAGAQFPFGPGGDPYDYTRLHIDNGSCDGPLTNGHPAGSDLPATFDCKGSQKLTSYAPRSGDSDYDQLVESNPQELYGVKGSSTNLGWEVTTGRPDTVIAVMDSGIEWNSPKLVNKVHLNSGELPLPCSSACTWQQSANWKDYDVNHDGVFNIKDYASDPRLAPGNGSYLTPQDLIRTFSDASDEDGNGYTDDIAGWDFYQNDNDPSDDVTYGHGTGEATDSSSEAGVAGNITQCLNCMFEPLRVGDSFVAEIDRWAAGVVYAVDNGVSIVQEALGTVDHTGFSQTAVDYAYAHGVLIVASEADEEAGHHNYPAALNHTMVVNSLTHFFDPAQVPKSYLTFNGCTNWGGYTWVSVPSNSCSSDATGQSAGMAGLLYSAARNAVQQGRMAPDASGRPLSAEEAKQMFRLAADDVDFSTPKPPFGPPNNFFTSLPDTVRYVTTGGWDQITGWGRINAATLLKPFRGAGSVQIPPVADVTSPAWWAPLGVHGHVDVVGSVDAPRADHYTYEVQYTPGVQPPRWPAADTWHTVATGAGQQKISGVLASIDLAQVRSAITLAVPAYTPADDPTSRDLPEKDAFRVRVVVHPLDEHGQPAGPDGIEQRQYFSHADADLFTGWPRNLNADGAGSPAFADLNRDGRDELVIADGNGYVHAFRSDGGELAGWPVHTDPIPLPSTGDNAFTRGELSRDVYAPALLGSPAIADLKNSGTLDVVISDTEGFVHAWDAHGNLLPGFPVRSNPAYSQTAGCQTGIGPNCDEFGPHRVRDHVNTVDRAFTSQPSIGKLEPSSGSYDIIVGSEDDHVYAWRADGTPVPGWPVLLRDPAKVQSVDPVTHFITFKSDANAKYGKQVLTSVSLDVDPNSGRVAHLAVNVDEEYEETPNWSYREPVLKALPVTGQVTSGNTRTYLLWPDGTNHAQPETVPGLGDNAYVPGWPVKVGMVLLELLPDVGSGSDASPTFATVGGKRVLATASIASPPYVFNVPSGTPYYGTDPEGHPITMASMQAEFKSRNATDGPTIASIGGGVFGRLGGADSPLSWAMGSSGLKRLLDLILPDQQLGAEDHISAWDVRTGTFAPGFPEIMNDLMFFNTPAIADLNGDGLAEVIQGSAMYDLRAYGLGGTVPLGWPKFTGGWVVSTPGTGDFDGDGLLDIAIVTREGNLFVWHTKGRADQPAEWPKYQHDLMNTGDYGSDGLPG